MNTDQLTLDEIIRRNNPFDRSLVVRTADIWVQHFPDDPTINGIVSDAILQGIAQIKEGQRNVLGVTIKAERGLGKSHLLSRIRSHIKKDNDSFFYNAP